MKHLSNLYGRMRHLTVAAVALVAAVGAVSCADDSDEQASDMLTVAFDNVLPDNIDQNSVVSATLKMTELNTGASYEFNPFSSELASLPLGVYDYNGTMRVNTVGSDGSSVERTLRTVGSSVSIASAMRLKLDWFYSNPAGSLVFSEIYAAGSPNAKGTNGLRDTYFRIYNNTDEVIYADGIGICESALINSSNNAYEILTPANDRQVNFTAGTVWVIPGNGTEHPIEPGKSIKIVDQAIDWNAQVSGALNHTDADFEWYDDHAQDTDNPSVTNLDKWYCYSVTIWIMSNQCNRSYALVRFPEGTTAESYLANYHGPYEYINASGNRMSNSKAYLIPNEWIIDGVNLSNDEKWAYGALGNAIDLSYASISTVNADPNRFGRYFKRKVAAEVNGVTILQDTNDSSVDFQTIKF